MKDNFYVKLLYYCLTWPVFLSLDIFSAILDLMNDDPLKPTYSYFKHPVVNTLVGFAIGMTIGYIHSIVGISFASILLFYLVGAIAYTAGEYAEMRIEFGFIALVAYTALVFSIFGIVMVTY